MLQQISAGQPNSSNQNQPSNNTYGAPNPISVSTGYHTSATPSAGFDHTTNWPVDGPPITPATPARLSSPTPAPADNHINSNYGQHVVLEAGRSCTSSSGAGRNLNEYSAASAGGMQWAGGGSGYQQHQQSVVTSQAQHQQQNQQQQQQQQQQRVQGHVRSPPACGSAWQDDTDRGSHRKDPGGSSRPDFTSSESQAPFRGNINSNGSNNAVPPPFQSPPPHAGTGTGVFSWNTREPGAQAVRLQDVRFEEGSGDKRWKSREFPWTRDLEVRQGGSEGGWEGERDFGESTVLTNIETFAP